MAASSMNKISHATALQKLCQAKREGTGDPEVAHGIADDVLCAFLRTLGYDDIVEAWEQVPKWYA